MFDTWKGTPIDDPLCHHKKGEWPARLDECKKLVGTDEFALYWEGNFPSVQDSAILYHRYCFAYIDMDTEQGTRDAIKQCWPRIIPGGKIVIDDYGWGACAGVKKAVDEAFSESQRTVVQSLYTCIVEKR